MSSTADLQLYETSVDGGKNPNIFLKKQWLKISDQQNGIYRSNQSVIVTTALANDSRYADYRGAHLAMPLVYTLSGDACGATQTAATSLDYSIGYKNWHGQMIHSIQVSLGGSTIVQQTPFCNIWNHFKLMTSLSYGDVASIGASIGFYPDDALSFGFNTASTTDGQGTSNNRNAFQGTRVSGTHNGYNDFNEGFLKRQQYINYDPDGLTNGGSQLAYSSLLTANACNNIHKSYIFKKLTANPAQGVVQIAVMAILPLKQLHSFFDNMVLSKGVNLTITLNLNQTQVTVGVAGGKEMSITSVVSQSNGTNPLMIASATPGAAAATGVPATADNGSAAVVASKTLRASVFVGNQVQWNQQITDGADAASPFTSQVMLCVPVYVFDPVVEQAYLSSAVKRVMYTDIAQYLIQNIAPNSQFNSLVTNSQAGLKSVLAVPYFTATSSGIGMSPLMSPFDSAAATTSPLTLINNYQVKISGENALLDNALYTYETFYQNLFGCNSYSAGTQYGLGGEGLINQLQFESGYCYHYVNVSRMPASELSVGKSIQLSGVSQSARALDLYVFSEFGCSIALNVLTGARVE